MPTTWNQATQARAKRSDAGVARGPYNVHVPAPAPRVQREYAITASDVADFCEAFDEMECDLFQGAKAATHPRKSVRGGILGDSIPGAKWAAHPWKDSWRKSRA